MRRISFDDVVDGLDADLAADGDVILPHLVAALSGLFPDGEEMFIDAVRHYRDEVTDPDLRRQVNAFIGQEVTHGREHRRLNERLAELGYRSKLVEATLQNDAVLTPGMARIARVFTRFGPLRDLGEKLDQDEPFEPEPIMLLALTAALEHYTATMAETLLSEPELQRRFADEAFFRMWAWHAIEECEHKAVAFDVFKAVGGDEETRLRAMRLATAALAFIAGYHTVVGTLRDRRSYRGLALPKSVWRLEPTRCSPSGSGPGPPTTAARTSTRSGTTPPRWRPRGGPGSTTTAPGRPSCLPPPDPDSSGRRHGGAKALGRQPSPGSTPVGPSAVIDSPM